MFSITTNKNASRDFSFDTKRNKGVIIKRPIITTPKINITDVIKTSITVAPKLNERPAKTGNVASNGIDNKSWNNKIEKV